MKVGHTENQTKYLPDGTVEIMWVHLKQTIIETIIGDTPLQGMR